MGGAVPNASVSCAVLCCAVLCGKVAGWHLKWHLNQHAATRHSPGHVRLPLVQLPGFKRILNYIKKVEEQEVRSVLLAIDAGNVAGCTLRPHFPGHSGLQLRRYLAAHSRHLFLSTADYGSLDSWLLSITYPPLLPPTAGAAALAEPGGVRAAGPAEADGGGDCGGVQAGGWGGREGGGLH